MFSRGLSLVSLTVASSRYSDEYSFSAVVTVPPSRHVCAESLDAVRHGLSLIRLAAALSRQFQVLRGNTKLVDSRLGRDCDSGAPSPCNPDTPFTKYSVRTEWHSVTFQTSVINPTKIYENLFDFQSLNSNTWSINTGICRD